MIKNAKWIIPAESIGDEVCPIYSKKFDSENVISAKLTVTALGLYEAFINGKRVGNFILAPGWTDFNYRLQYQEYDVTDMLADNNTLSITVGKGWRRSDMCGWRPDPAALIAELELTYNDGTVKSIVTDESWTAKESQVRFSEIYHGEIYDAAFTSDKEYAVMIHDGPYDTLIPHEGCITTEQDIIYPAKIFTTPQGDVMIDFGQNLTGYVEVTVDAKAGDVVDLSCSEVMDKDGNFYNANYRNARCRYRYICKEGKQSYKPHFTFYGFRYMRINEFPGGAGKAKLSDFKGIVVHSEMERTGYITCGEPTLNKFFENAVWGQKDNFLDVPTDCPQRNERLGWTGDIQAFIRTACLNYDVEVFFKKWLHDLRASQRENGAIDKVIPAVFGAFNAPSAWGDAATICPWEVYKAYGNKELLAVQYESMKKWVDHITSVTTTPDLWTGYQSHYGDWLGLDAKPGSYEGSSDKELIDSAYYARSTDIVIKAGKILGEDVTKYEELSKRIHKAYREKYNKFSTQTECVMTIVFNLTDEPEKVGQRLCNLIRECGNHLTTGFVGAPYLLYALSKTGNADIAYDLLLRQEYPSWLFSVTKGATTVWEHWDGINDKGEFWGPEMNSFNHYAYGAALGWVYNYAAGIEATAEAPAYSKPVIAPHPDKRLGMLDAVLNTRNGVIRSEWKIQEDYFRYNIEVPVDATIIIGDERYEVKPGRYTFFQKL